MPHWLLKSAAHRAISMLPGSHWLNSLGQRFLTGTLELTPGRLEMRLNHCRIHYEHLLQYRTDDSADFTVHETGTGWYPIVPVGLYLCGASEIWTYDLEPRLNVPRLRTMLGLLRDYAQNGKLRGFLPAARPDRITRLLQTAEKPVTRLEDYLEPLNIHFQVRDGCDSRRPNGSIDLFTTTGVLEYLPPSAIPTLLSEYRRMGSPRALQSHYIGMGDDYAFFDKSITTFNFLQYSERAWRWLGSPVIGQNRLRITDYRRAFTNNGCRILKESTAAGNEKDLDRVKLAPEFQSYPREDLVVTYAWIVAEATNQNGGRIP